MTQQKSVRFSGMIGFSDNRTGYLPFENRNDAEESSTAFQRWNVKPQPPARTGSFPYCRPITMPVCNLPPTLPQRRRTMEYSQMSRAEDDSILYAPQNDSLDISGRSLDSMMPRAVKLAETSSWFSLMSRDGDDKSAPVMPKRKLSGNLDTPPTSPDSSTNGDGSVVHGSTAAQWEYNVPSSPVFE
ncbi:unnamed protein product [Cylindrotheca closterium]|uniref:Uncharacterized protein n=1 Tax=Cylindrotheca closterium TaxID=2856 RepID=A0AAD2GCX7_9STRA|nr:unnamed protein product [Cylindrotheca closterium]